MQLNLCNPQMYLTFTAVLNIPQSRFIMNCSEDFSTVQRILYPITANASLVLPVLRSCDSMAKQMLLLNTIIHLAQYWRMLRLSCVNGSNVGVYAKNILVFL